MPTIALPIQLDFLRWTAQLQLDLVNFSIPIAHNEEDWRKWAVQLIQLNPTLKNIPLPTKQSYPNAKDWRKWALSFMQVIEQQ